MLSVSKTRDHSFCSDAVWLMHRLPLISFVKSIGKSFLHAAFLSCLRKLARSPPLNTDGPFASLEIAVSWMFTTCPPSLLHTTNIVCYSPISSLLPVTMSSSGLVLVSEKGPTVLAYSLRKELWDNLGRMLRRIGVNIHMNIT